jgi:type I restriction enzyme M protein
MVNIDLNDAKIRDICSLLMHCCTDKIYIISRIFKICFDKQYIQDTVLNRTIYTSTASFYNEQKINNIDGETIKILDSLNYEELREVTKQLIIFSKSSYGYRDYLITQSQELNDLIIDLLDLKSGKNKVFDFGFGEGNFLLNVLDKSKKDSINIESISGCEINQGLYDLARMTIAIFNDKNISIKLINCNGLKKGNFVFNKGFVFPPFGLKVYNDCYQTKLDKNIVISGRMSTEWAFVDKMINESKDFDKIITILPPKCLYNVADDNYKRALIKNGLIEGIIELPNNLFDLMSIKTYIVIISKNNKEVKFLNASEMIKSQDRKGLKTILDNNKIFEAFNAIDVEKVSNEELLKRDELNLTRVFEVEVNFKNAIPLSSVAEIFTGSQYTLRNFEKYLCNDKKECTYKLIASNDIDEYSINWSNLKMINDNDKKLEKFAVQKNDVIITSKSSKVKIAVVDFDPDIKCIVTGGMFIVRPDIAKLNPYYLKVFLESSIGIEILKSIQKGGSFIFTITGSNLANIKINLIDIDKQNLIADKYIDKLTSLLAYKKQIKDIETSLSNLYQDECEE